ncbi:MAG TPA: glycosyltransferase family 4 protein [Burkholderiales bacterium]|nr:glycosyltransferase family 4 protein [Burkholderiales bacterium]
MRLAIVRQRYTPYGGAERFIERTLPALERAGAEVTLIARRVEGWNSGRVITLDPFYLGSAWRDRSFAQAARKAWRLGAFDLVQSHERIAGCDIYRAGDGVHRRWLEIRRAGGGALERLGLALNPHHRYVLAEERRLFEHPRLRAVICNSAMVRGEVLEGFRIAPEKLHVIPNGVDLEHFHPRHGAALRAAARSGLGLAEDEFAFLYVGSGFARKGLDLAIAALARTLERRFVLLAAGRDRHAARFAELARLAGVAERVRLLGPREDVRPLYAAADCFILPTRYDPFPGAALEALAMGLPAIVGRRCGAAEALAHGRSGWVSEPEDVAGLARLMQNSASELAGDAGKARRAAARATAENYGIDTMARKLTELYAALAAKAA